MDLVLLPEHIHLLTHCLGSFEIVFSVRVGGFRVGGLGFGVILEGRQQQSSGQNKTTNVHNNENMNKETLTLNPH